MLAYCLKEPNPVPLATALRTNATSASTNVSNSKTGYVKMDLELKVVVGEYLNH